MCLCCKNIYIYIQRCLGRSLGDRDPYVDLQGGGLGGGQNEETYGQRVVRHVIQRKSPGNEKWRFEGS